MNDSRRWFVFALVAACVFLLYLLSPVLTPFIVAATLAYMGDPLVDRLERKLSRSVSVLIVFALIISVILLLLLILLPMLEGQISVLIKKLPVYLDRLQHIFLPWLQQQLGQFDPSVNFESLKQAVLQAFSGVGGVVKGVASTLSSSGLAVIGFFANIVLIPVLTFYLLRDWDILVERVHELIPRRFEATTVRLAQESDEVLGAFVRGQVSVMAALGTIYSIGLWIVGLDLALLIGMMAGAVSFVPYLGFIVGIVIAGAAAMLQFQDVIYLVYIGLVFGVGQVLESFLLTPFLVGDRIGLHPVAVIFAVMAGGQLFGFFGILLALPVAAVLMVILRHAHERYVQSQLYGGGR